MHSIFTHLFEPNGAAKAPLEDVVPVSNNLAYQMVTTLQRIQKEDKNSKTVRNQTLPQYENITEINAQNNGELPQYENITEINHVQNNGEDDSESVE